MPLRARKTIESQHFIILRDAVSCTATFPTALEELVRKETQVLAHTHSISEGFFFWHG